MAAIPVRLPPLPGEAIDSWLEAYADLLHVAVRDFFALAGADWGRLNGGQRQGKPWLCQLDEPDLAALSAATGVPAGTLAGMTLARSHGTGLPEVMAEPGMPRTPRWWRQLTASRYCPRCLAANGGRRMLAWRIPWAFACTSDPADTPAITLPPGGHVLAAQQHIDALIAALLTSRERPAETAALQQQLDDLHAVARAAVSAVNGPAALPAAATAVLSELDGWPSTIPALHEGGAGTSVPSGPVRQYRRQLAPVTAFGVAIADIMLHGRHGDPDPVIAAWLAGNTASRRNTSGPADVLIHWDQASPALQAALAKPLASRLDTFRQLRQLEAAAGTTLLRIEADGTITLTADGEQFARNALAALNMAEPAHDSRHQPPDTAALG